MVASTSPRPGLAINIAGARVQRGSDSARLSGGSAQDVKKAKQLITMKAQLGWPGSAVSLKSSICCKPLQKRAQKQVSLKSSSNCIAAETIARLGFERDDVEQVHRILNVAFHALLARQIRLTGRKTIPRDFKILYPGSVADLKMTFKAYPLLKTWCDARASSPMLRRSGSIFAPSLSRTNRCTTPTQSHRNTSCPLSPRMPLHGSWRYGLCLYDEVHDLPLVGAMSFPAEFNAKRQYTVGFSGTPIRKLSHFLYVLSFCGHGRAIIPDAKHARDLHSGINVGNVDAAVEIPGMLCIRDDGTLVFCRSRSTLPSHTCRAELGEMVSKLAALHPYASEEPGPSILKRDRPSEDALPTRHDILVIIKQPRQHQQAGMTAMQEAKMLSSFSKAARAKRWRKLQSSAQKLMFHPALVATSLAESEDRPLDLKAQAHAAFRDLPSTRAQVAVGFICRNLARTDERHFDVEFNMPIPDETLAKQLGRSERPQKITVFCDHGTLCLLLVRMLDLVGVGILNVFGGDRGDPADGLDRCAQVRKVSVLSISLPL